MDIKDIKPGMKVEILDSSCCPTETTRKLIGSIADVVDVGEHGVGVAVPGVNFQYAFSPSDLKAIDPEQNSDPVINFKIHGRNFYVGQKVWSTASAGILSEGDPMEIVGAFKKETLFGRKVGSWETCILDPDLLSFEPPALHNWRRGDWARHKDGRKAFVCGAWRPNGPFCPQSLIVSFPGEAITNIPASQFSFISRAEEPE